MSVLNCITTSLVWDFFMHFLSWGAHDSNLFSGLSAPHDNCYRTGINMGPVEEFRPKHYSFTLYGPQLNDLNVKGNDMICPLQFLPVYHILVKICPAPKYTRTFCKISNS